MFVFRLQDNQFENKQNDKENKVNTVESPLMPSKLDKKVPPPVTPSKSPVPEIIQDNQDLLKNHSKNDAMVVKKDDAASNGEKYDVNNDKVEEIRINLSEKQDMGKGEIFIANIILNVYFILK